MPAQSGLLHTWSHLRKSMKTSLQRFLASDSESLSKLQHVHLPSFFGQITDRGVNIGSAMKIRFLARYDDRLPLVIRANAELLRLTVSQMLDYAMDRHPGVGYTTFAVHLTEESDRDYVSFNVWHSGVSRSGDEGLRSWFNRNEMEEFATRMGGYFLARDQHGTEARYAVRIPLIPGASSLVEQVSPAAQITGEVHARDGVTALVVDDSPISRVLGVAMLFWRNIAAEAVESGQQALRRLSAQRYDLIFIDYSLPKLNGIQSAVMLREKAASHCGLFVGLSPGAGSPRNIKAAFLQAGMQGCLTKPVDPRALDQLLLELLPQVYEQFSTSRVGQDTARPGLSRLPQTIKSKAPFGQKDWNTFAPSQVPRGVRDAAPPSRTGVPAPISGEQKSLVRELTGIAELDAEKGLANVGGNMEIYIGMLGRFMAELGDYIEPLLTLPIGGAWEEVALRLHVLREFFIGIGALALAQDAAALMREAAAKAAGGEASLLPQDGGLDGADAWLPRIQRYCDAMMRLRAKLAGLHVKKTQEHATDQRELEWERTDPADLVKLNRYVLRLHDACLSHRAAQAQETVDGLRRMAVHKNLEEHITTICRLVDALDYPEARERCAKLLKAIKMHRLGAAEENGSALQAR